MLYSIMRYIRNFFPVEDGGENGKYTITDGALSLPFMVNGQYFLIEGSKFNDGVYKYPVADLTDEVFFGCITPLAIPKEFLALTKEIETWQQANASVSPYASESFGGYSYTRATNADGNTASWKNAFASRLNVWRKL